MKKVNAQQVDEIVRLLGTLSAACLSGAAIGIARPEQVTLHETASLALTFLILFGCLLYLRKEKP